MLDWSTNWYHIFNTKDEALFFAHISVSVLLRKLAKKLEKKQAPRSEAFIILEEPVFRLFLRTEARHIRTA